ncbi:TPA: hypothetical protein HA246_02155 [Candidatus Woesearchaeota archaeon]|nr:hypothetical protein [Candidatus Woesearchaeota archaeon]
MKKVLLLLILTIILVGCTQFQAGDNFVDDNIKVSDKKVDKPIDNKKASNSPTPEIKTINEPNPEAKSTPETITPQINDNFPTITTRVSPSNPNLGETVELTVSSEDDIGIKHLSFESAKAFVEGSTFKVFECNLQKTCTNTWKLIPAEEATYEILIVAVDSAGHSVTSNVKLEVNPARKIVSKCGNGFCNSEENEQSCPQDCYIAPLFACANNICEGGESYESCPQDCGVSNIIGTTRGDGACEPGEDIKNSPKDCTIINPKCGNNICEANETTITCSADCEQESSVEEASCTSNAACGYKKACKGGKCVSVQCTSDSHCTGCKRCSSNRCVSCGYGSAGFCTC